MFSRERDYSIVSFAILSAKLPAISVILTRQVFAAGGFVGTNPARRQNTDLIFEKYLPAREIPARRFIFQEQHKIARLYDLHGVAVDGLKD